MTESGVVYYHEVDYVYLYKGKEYYDISTIVKATSSHPPKKTIEKATPEVLKRYRHTISYEEYFKEHPKALETYNQMKTDFEKWLREKYAVFSERRYPHVLLSYIQFAGAFIPHYKLHILHSGRSNSSKTLVQRETVKILFAYDTNIDDRELLN